MGFCFYCPGPVDEIAEASLDSYCRKCYCNYLGILEGDCI